jgi:putative SOS response-associated peptidase YedK
VCGRARLSSDVSEIKLVFGIPPERPMPNFAPSWNVAPTDPLPVVRYDAKDLQRSLDVGGAGWRCTLSAISVAAKS